METIHLGKTIRRLRKAYGCSQETLAAALYVTTQAVSKWECGKAQPEVQLLPAIAAYFHITIDELFYGIDWNHSDSLQETTKAYLEHNASGWDQIAHTTWRGTILPEYGPYAPIENNLHLFGDFQNKKVLELACGGGESLCYAAHCGATELYGLDISPEQITKAKCLLHIEKIDAQLFVSPMEQNPGIPTNYFDCVYSIYGIGWTMDLDKTIELVSKYLKKNGIFVFSWDNPILPCIAGHNGHYVLDRSYVTEGMRELTIYDIPLQRKNWKMASYISTLAKHGFMVEQLVEESAGCSEDATYQMRYYTAHKANYLNLSFIIKARKL